MTRVTLFHITFVGTLTVFIWLIAGCELNRPSEHRPFVTASRSAVLAVVLDLSGSFADRVHENGHGYRLLLAISDSFFRKHVASESRFVISQLSGNDRSLIFAGGPNDFRNKFANADQFREFLENRSDASASRVNASFADTLDYVSTMPGVEAKTAIWVIVISDLIDSTDDSAAEQKLDRELQEFAAFPNAAIGLYYVDQHETPQWRRRLDNFGFSDRSFISPDFVDVPELPNFE